MTEHTFDIWELQPGGRETTGWSNVRRDISLAECEEYELAAIRRIHIEIHVPLHLRRT
jgi:hypothetical protein